MAGFVQGEGALWKVRVHDAHSQTPSQMFSCAKSRDVAGHFPRISENLADFYRIA